MNNQKTTPKPKVKKSITFYIRSLHRDVGFFAVGLIIIYALSGMVLIYRDTNLLKADTQIEKKLSPNMEGAKIGEVLRIRDFAIIKTEGETIYFKEGSYNKTTGMALVTVKDIIFPFNKLLNFHKAQSKNPTHWFNILFGVILLFMACSSFWMFRPENKNFRRGLYLARAGIVFLIILLIV